MNCKVCNVLAPFFLILLLFKVKYWSQPSIRPVRRSCIVSVQFSSEAHHAWHGIGNSTYWIWTITKMQHNPNFQFSKWTFGNGHTFFLPQGQKIGRAGKKIWVRTSNDFKRKTGHIELGLRVIYARWSEEGNSLDWCLPIAHCTSTVNYFTTFFSLSLKLKRYKKQ